MRVKNMHIYHAYAEILIFIHSFIPFYEFLVHVHNHHFQKYIIYLLLMTGIYTGNNGINNINQSCS